MTDTKDEGHPQDFLARILANRSPERRSVLERMEKVRSIYLPTAHDRRLSTEFDWLLDTMAHELGGESARSPHGFIRGGRALLVTGAAGAGKSRALAHAFATRPEFEGFGKHGSPLLSVVAPSPFTLGALGNEIAGRLGYVTRRALRQNEVWPLVRGLMREARVRILHIDEAQHGDQIANRLVAQEIENTLKRMMQEADWPIWLILSGLPELSRFCQDDASMKRRVRIVHFESLRFPDHAEAVLKLVREMAALCPPLGCSKVQSDEFAHRLLYAAMWQFGIVVEYVQDAIGECLLGGDEELDLSHFADVYTARTGSAADDMNVFIARNWTAIPVEMALYDDEAERLGNAFAPASASGRKRRKR